jgi:hypothetical protein
MQTNVRNLHAEAVTADSSIAADVAMIVSQRPKDGGSASTIALHSSFILHQHRIDQTVVDADLCPSLGADVLPRLFLAHHLPNSLPAQALGSANTLDRLAIHENSTANVSPLDGIGVH